MESLYYSAVGFIAVIVHLIINHNMFSRPKRGGDSTVVYFHFYLVSILFYYITDIFWGIFDYAKDAKFLYIDTVIYYVAMAFSVVCCCSYIIAFLKLNKKFGKILRTFGLCFFIAEFIALIINFFTPIFFFVDESGNYHTGAYCHFALIIQVIMFAVITLISFVVALRKSAMTNRRNITICLFGFVMIVSIIVQGFFPLLPFYSVGLMVGICILHVFVQEDEKNEHLEVLDSLAEVFYSMNVIDLVDDSVIEFHAKNEVKAIANHKNGAVDMMRKVIQAVTKEECLEDALAFTDLTTVAQRMVNKKIISGEFIGKHVGWFLACFITLESDESGKPTKVIYTTRDIDDIKQHEKKLIYKTKTDEMTGLNNRRAYEDDIYAHDDTPTEDEFIYVSIDVNGLKVVNDTKGHLAGDELIVGASQCMKDVLGPYGSLYRIGGDEFVAILLTNTSRILEILSDFDLAISNWKGELIDGISVSYGWVNKQEAPSASTRELGAIAEARMYEAKTAHYRKIGVDRRGQQDAHKALCELYTKILKINLTEDSYQIINMDTSEQTSEKGFSDSISEWLSSFGKSGQVHPEDLEEYLRLTELSFMQDYFRKKKNSLHIFYRRKYEDGFKQVMMEIVTANDYADNNQSLFLYVKDIDV
ncbi:MAG: diguanylate cyclase [Treponema sp.]|nr:diguanylate cyclase [Candidatus Treponema equifaecale]